MAAPVEYRRNQRLFYLSVMVLQLAGFSVDATAKELYQNRKWVMRIRTLPEFRERYPSFRRRIIEKYCKEEAHRTPEKFLMQMIEKNPEAYLETKHPSDKALLKWYPDLLGYMHDAAEGKIQDKTRIMAIQKLFEIAGQYKAKQTPKEELRPIMTDGKAQEMHEEIKELIKLHETAIGKLNQCPKENLSKILNSS